MTIQFHKPTWTHLGFFKYRLDYISKCKEWMIYRFENSKNYYIAYKSCNLREEPITTLKSAKEYINECKDFLTLVESAEFE